MLRMHDVLDLTDRLDINKSPAVVVIQFKGLQELQNSMTLGQNVQFVIYKGVRTQGVWKAAGLILMQNTGSRGLDQELELVCVTGRQALQLRCFRHNTDTLHFSYISFQSTLELFM